jgi:hypothetical protein
VAWHVACWESQKILKEIISAKTFRAHSTNFFRQEKSFQDLLNVCGMVRIMVRVGIGPNRQ